MSFRVCLQSDNSNIQLNVAHAQDQVVSIIEKAVNSSEMDELIADQVLAFAGALKPPMAGLKSAILTDPSWKNSIPIKFHWKSFQSEFGQFKPR